MSDNLVGLATKDRRPNLHYDLINPATGVVYPCHQKGWRYSKETIEQKISEGRILWPASKTGRPRHKKFAEDLKSEFAGFSSFINCGNTNEGTEEVSRIMGGEQFIFPKPRTLIQTLLQQTTSDDDLILDSFGGTGTTAHAVMAQNAADGGFILIEMDENICKTVTCERLKRVVRGTAMSIIQAKQLTLKASAAVSASANSANPFSPQMAPSTRRSPSKSLLTTSFSLRPGSLCHRPLISQPRFLAPQTTSQFTSSTTEFSAITRRRAAMCLPVRC